MSADEAMDALRVVHEVTKRVHASRDLAATLDAVVQGVQETVGFDVVYLSLAMPDQTMHMVSVLGPPDARDALMAIREPVDNIRRLLALAEPEGALHFVDHTVEEVDAVLESSWAPDLPISDDPDAWHPDDLLCAVLTTPTGEWLGILGVDVPRDGRKPDATQRQLLEIFADHAAIAIMHARLHAELVASRAEFERAATHDALTGLGNRTLLARHADLVASPSAPVGVVTIDLDDFKAVNDTCGHDAGDEVLQVVAARLRACVRTQDLLVRTGGDEFVVVLAGPGSASAAPELAHRLALLLSEPIAGTTGTHRVGASIGTAVATGPVALATLLAAADEQMYLRKREHHARQAVPLAR